MFLNIFWNNFYILYFNFNYSTSLLNYILKQPSQTIENNVFFIFKKVKQKSVFCSGNCFLVFFFFYILNRRSNGAYIYVSQSYARSTILSTKLKVDPIHKVVIRSACILSSTPVQLFHHPNQCTSPFSYSSKFLFILFFDGKISNLGQFL